MAPKIARPNLLFLYTDEQRRDTLAAYGNRQIAMPNLNALAERSTVFERAYCTAPVCTPSRGSIVTGLYAHAHGAIVNNLAMRGDAACLPECLPPNLYACGHFGKWHLGDEIFPQHGFTDWRGTEDTYHATFLPPRAEFTPERSHYHHWLVARGIKPWNLRLTLPANKWHPAHENRFFREQIHGLPEELSRPAFLAEQAVEFIGTHRARPWVLYVNFLEPHMPFHSCRDRQYDPADVTLPDGWPLELGPDAPLRLRLQAAHNRHGGCNEERALREVVARYWGMCSLVDTHTGRILAALRGHGLEENTIVVFTSDHGDMMGSHGLHAKGQLFDESAGVPLLIHAPGQQTARRVTCPVSQVDLVPTLLDLMGQPPPARTHGASLRPQVEGRAAATGRDVAIQWHTDHARRTPPPALPEHQTALGTPEQAEAALAETIRTLVTPDGWKLNWSGLGDHELYDLNADPLESRNLARDPAQRDRLRGFAARLRDWQRRTGDTLMPIPE
jgi:arylsulfatase